MATRTTEPEVIFSDWPQLDHAHAAAVLAYLLTPLRAFVFTGDDPCLILAIVQTLYRAKCDALTEWYAHAQGRVMR